MRVFLAGASGILGRWVIGMTKQRGASNSKARVEPGWSPEPASWRDGCRHAPTA
jgi:hypothetical protein